MKEPIKKRVDKLEDAKRVGRSYFVRSENGVYEVDGLVMDEVQYWVWLAKRIGENDSVVVFEVKRGCYENGKKTD